MQSPFDCWEKIGKTIIEYIERNMDEVTDNMDLVYNWSSNGSLLSLCVSHAGIPT